VHGDEFHTVFFIARGFFAKFDANAYFTVGFSVFSHYFFANFATQIGIALTLPSYNCDSFNYS